MGVKKFFMTKSNLGKKRLFDLQLHGASVKEVGIDIGRRNLEARTEAAVCEYDSPDASNFNPTGILFMNILSVLPQADLNFMITSSQPPE